MGWAENVVCFWAWDSIWPGTAEQIKRDYELPWYAFVIPLVPVALVWLGLKAAFRKVRLNQEGA